MNEFSKHVGLDVHKATIAVAVADAGRGQARFVGEIPNTRPALLKLVRQLAQRGARLAFCYEAGPCGYEVYRQLRELGQACDVVAPSLIPKRVWRSGQDRPPGCVDLGAAASRWRVDSGMGAQWRSRSLA